MSKKKVADYEAGCVSPPTTEALTVLMFVLSGHLKIILYKTIAVKLLAVFEFSSTCNCPASVVGETHNDGVRCGLQFISFRSNASKGKNLLFVSGLLDVCRYIFILTIFFNF